MVDLRVHTSDCGGNLDTREILIKADKLKLDVISITDFNSVDAYLYLMCNPRDRLLYSGKLISGVELLGFDEGNIVEILAYGFDVKKLFIDKIDSFLQKEILKHFIRVCKSNKIILDENLDISDYGRNSIAYYVFINSLLRNNSYSSLFGKDFDSLRTFFNQEYTNYCSSFYFDSGESYRSVESVIDDIHVAGGLSFVMNPDCNSIESLISRFDFDGIECVSNHVDIEEQRYLKDLCMRYGKYILDETESNLWVSSIDNVLKLYKQ